MKLRIVSALAAAALLCCGIAQAQIPHKLNYQGFLTSPSGAPINSASSQMVFNIYSVQTLGAPLHTETQTVTVSNGIFNVLLGTNTALTLPFDTQYYLGVTTGADPEMSPRQPLAASPYALRAVMAESLAPGGNIVLTDPSTASAGNIMKGSSRFIHNAGFANTFIGVDSGNFTVTGSSNTITGANALGNVTSGNSNTASGYFALIGNTSGSYNIALGTGAGGALTTGDFNIDIGNAGVAGEAATIRLGTSQTRAFIAGVRGVTPEVNDALPVVIDSNGQLGTAASGSTTLAGDVTGPQSATVVSRVGGVMAANVAAGAVLANAATNAMSTSTIVKRDASGSFSANTISIVGTLNLPSTDSSGTQGVIKQTGNRLLHSFGGANFFAGSLAGNFSMTGGNNTGIGNTALAASTSGGQNTATGALALATNSSGGQNTASGYLAMQSNTTGGNNVAMGANALQLLTTGNFNTAIGGAALANIVGSSSNNIGIGAGAGGNHTSGNFNINIGNPGVAGQSNVIRIGSSQTDTYLAGIIRGNGSGLTNVPVTIANGSITSAMTGTGAAQFVRTIQSPNDFVPPGSAFTIDTQAFNSVPSSIVASAGAGGTVFTFGATGTYVLDYEMSLSTAGSIGIYTGPNAGSLVLDSNSVTGAVAATTWIHGRTLVVTGASPVVVAISPVAGTASIAPAGTAPGNYMIRLTVLKI